MALEAVRRNGGVTPAPDPGRSAPASAAQATLDAIAATLRSIEELLGLVDQPPVDAYWFTPDTKFFTPGASGAQRLFENAHPHPVLVRVMVTEPAAAGTFDISYDAQVPQAASVRLDFTVVGTEARLPFWVEPGKTIYCNPSATDGSVALFVSPAPPRKKEDPK